MRKPRDFDAELKALDDKARNLKARRVTQLGELVAATGADTLDLDVLAGGLLALVEASDPARKESWRARGSAFFRGRWRGAARAAPPRDAGGTPSDGGAAAV